MLYNKIAENNRGNRRNTDTEETEPPKRRRGFQPGVSGNPKGRPKKGKSLTDMLEKELSGLSERVYGKNGLPKTVRGKQVFARAVVEIAMDRTVAAATRLTAMNLIFERVEGKPRQSVEVDGTIESKPASLADVFDFDRMSAEDEARLAEIMKRQYDEQLFL